MFPGQCGNTAFFFKSQPDQFHFEFRGIVFPGKSFFSAHEVSTCKISGCLSYRILDSGPDGTQTTLTPDLRAAHERNDEVLERIYIGRRFKNDTERLEKLFDLYTKMIASTAPVKGKKRKAGNNE
ncbi:hypothetical protein OYB20_24440 [Escherichia coli]|nr:hypothetical protein [Escherichia coli]